MARTLIADQPGPVELDVHLPTGAGAITVIAEPDRRTAEVTISAHGNPAVVDAVERAVLRWEPSTPAAPGGALVVQVPEVTSGAVQSVAVGRGMTSVTQIVGHVPAGASVTGVSITGGDGIRVGGGAALDNGAAVAGGRVEITVRVPDDSRIRAVSRAADVTARGEYARVTFTSISGHLAVDRVGALVAKTVSGTVRAAAVNQRARIVSTSGDIRIDRAPTVMADSVFGAIYIGSLGGEDDGFSQLDTVSGDISVHAAHGSWVMATSVTGDITVTAEPAAVAAGLSVTATSYTGHVTTPDTHPTSATAHGQRT